MYRICAVHVEVWGWKMEERMDMKESEKQKGEKNIWQLYTYSMRYKES